jgi:predicted dehydrogenase
MRAAFVGAGGIAGNYLETLDGIEAADVVAVCDLVEERARDAADPRGAAVFTDVEALFREANFDALFVCVPPFAHGDPERLAAERDLDLFVAKPVARTVETGAELASVLAQSDGITQVGYMWRYADAVDRARGILDGRDLGLLDGRVWVGVPPADWWGTESRSGGQVVEQATHVYDLLRYLGGDVERATGTGGRPLDTRAVDFEDVTSVSLTHAGGAVGHVSTTCAAPDAGYSLDLIAEDCRLHLDCLANELEGVVDDEAVNFTGERDGYARQVEAFVAASDAGDPGRVRCDYADGLETLRTTVAAVEAARSDAAVEV